jgi:hypothetical protein
VHIIFANTFFREIPARKPLLGLWRVYKQLGYPEEAFGVVYPAFSCVFLVFFAVQGIFWPFAASVSFLPRIQRADQTFVNSLGSTIALAPRAEP